MLLKNFKESKIQLIIIFQIIKNNLIGFKKRFIWEALASLVDSGSWLIAYSLINPTGSISSSKYGLFILAGIIGSNAMWKMIPKITLMINDLNNDRTISYFLTLPINTNLLFIAISLSWAFEMILMSFIFLFIGKIIFFEQINIILLLTNIKFIGTIFINNLFFSFSALLMASFLKNTYTMIPLIISPTRSLGGFLCKWKTVFGLYKIGGIFLLINPILYTMEGIRAAMINQDDYISWSICSLVLIILTFIFGYFGIKKLKKRLDAI
jgi:hypothetical protein